MSLYSPESATLSIADPRHGLTADPRTAIQTAIDPPSCRIAASPASLVNEAMKPMQLAVHGHFACEFMECHDSYVAMPYRNLRKSPRTPLTTLSF
jgi:hypothetical protein